MFIPLLCMIGVILVCAIVMNEDKINEILRPSQYVDSEVDTLDGL